MNLFDPLGVLNSERVLIPIGLIFDLTVLGSCC